MADQAWEAGQILVSAVAGEDLSDKQFRFVRLSGANTVSAISATTQVPVGVLAGRRPPWPSPAFRRSRPAGP